MPTATGKLPGNGLLNLLNGGVVWGTSDLYFALLSTTGNSAIDIDATDFWNDLVANEVTGTNWAANGKQISGETLSLVTGGNDVEFDLTDISVASCTLSDGKAGVIINRTPGTDATRHFVGYATFDTALAPAGGTLDIDFPTTGFVLIDYT